jgi:hypothetical protein
VVPGDRAADAVGVKMHFTMAHAEVPGHTVAVDTSDRLWIAARCTCGKDFSRRKWIKAARHVIEDVDQHLRELAPGEEPYDEWEFGPKPLTWKQAHSGEGCDR